ncbi:MAG: imidazole glycerol phosphate synthase subunit HisH [Spirochaetaceae bacterium]|nr:MAG: imidazole glycerol phosphate synthase subunit HisH [Spirochaetaceae bacterium]
MKTCVVDYKAGNLRSVQTALEFLKADFIVTADPDVVAGADKLIFPGVGEARAAMSVLEETGLGKAIQEFHKTGKPLLGICLGSQIILESSEESDTLCLGLIPGKARLFPSTPGFKIPHMGWNQVSPVREHEVMKGVPTNASFYFVHSYYPEPGPDAVLAKSEYMISFPAALAKDNLVAFQFHPEKSGKYGLALLENFLAWKA